ncbi:hypothetical protein BHM03_00009779 [Ensete ventricosum]|nr:hypothetical protein BHM03_00009779 [Ensete ventricosum]
MHPPHACTIPSASDCGPNLLRSHTFPSPSCIEWHFHTPTTASSAPPPPPPPPPPPTRTNTTALLSDPLRIPSLPSSLLLVPELKAGRTTKMMSEEDKQQKKPAAVGEDAMAVESAEEGRTAEALLRVAPVGLCLAAMAIMLRNSQENDFGAVSYADLTAFKLSPYLVFANGVCAAYSLSSAFYVAMRRPSTLSHSWTVLTYVILAAGTVATEIVYLAYMGAEKVTWSKECSAFDGFCRRATTSLGFTFGSVACYVLLSLVSSYRLFSNYDTPITFLSSKGLEIAAYPC